MKRQRGDVVAGAPPGFPLVLVIVPTYNESGTIQELLGQILQLGPNYRVLVVDDDSPDGTWGLVEEWSRTHPGRVSLLRRQHKAGIGRAYIAGFRAALEQPANLIATMDGDLSHDPSDLVRLVDQTSVADLVLGSRYVCGGSTEGWPRHRRIISRWGGRYARAVLGVPIADLTCGFKVYRRAALASLNLDAIKSDGYVFQIETTYKTMQNGFRVVEVPIRFTDRVSGKSKLSRRIVIEAVFVVWRLRLERMLGRFR